MQRLFPDVVGWLASAILFATLFRQVWVQVQTQNPTGVSRWLFIGQMAASVLFLTYSLLLRNWIFSVSNSVILLVAIIGQWVSFEARRKNSQHDGKT
jgi:MtN3 and saliva related transmembrane protein